MSLRDETQRIVELEGAIQKARLQISGGLCYFSAEAKHAQLADADRTLAEVMHEIPLVEKASISTHSDDTDFER